MSRWPAFSPSLYKNKFSFKNSGVVIYHYSVLFSEFQELFCHLFWLCSFFLLLSVPKPVLHSGSDFTHFPHLWTFFFLALSVMCKLESNSKRDSDKDKDMRARDQIF